MRLIFVYNANAGLLAGFMDTVHKTVSPSTYACDLCAITFGAFTMNKDWKAYLAALGIPVDFYHKPDFRKAFPAQADLALPIIGAVEDGHIETLISAEDMKPVETVNELMALLDSRLSDLRQSPEPA